MRHAYLHRILKTSAVLAVIVLSSCATPPYVDSRREAGQKAPIGPSTADMPAICYSSHGAGRAAAAKLADSECAKTARTAKFDHEDSWACTIKTPTRAFFRCVAKP